MVIHHFLKWIETAKVSERAAAANALARAYAWSDLPFEERCAAEASLTLLLDDPSPKVRLAMAEPLSLCPHAPPQVISALASDQPEIAAMVLVRSPLFTDADLIDRVAGCNGAVQQLIAMRPQVSMGVSAAIAEVGEADACRELLCNIGADIASLSLRRMAERHGHLPDLRELLLRDPRTPADAHHVLMVKLGEALKDCDFVRALIGPQRAEKVTREACASASIALIEATSAHEHAALVEHLRLAGELTGSFMVRLVAYGKIDFFGAALVALSGQKEGRVRALLAGGRDGAVTALLRSAGIAVALHGAVLCALRIWREVAKGRRVAGPQEVSWLMMREAEAVADGGKLANLLRSIHLQALRDNARAHAAAIAAA